MRTSLAFASLSLLLAAPWAAAENAAAEILNGDKLHGTIVTPGDEDRISLYLPAGSRLTVQLKQDKNSELLPELGLEDPEGGSVDPGDAWSVNGSGTKGTLKKLEVGDRGGLWVLLPRDATEGEGRYFLQVKKVAYVTKLGVDEEVTGQGNLELAIDAPAGSTLDFSVKPSKKSDADPEVVALEGPSGPLDIDSDLKQKKIPCNENGTYLLRVKNDGATSGGIKIDLKLKTPKKSKRKLYLSPDGFGEAPKIDEVDPSTALDDRVAEGVMITGTGFDEEAEVWLELSKEDPILPETFNVINDTRIMATFDVVDVKTGSWKLKVLNPSGGSGDAKFKVKKAGDVKLPKGVKKDTEVWWIDFDEDIFPQDLDAMGLGSSSSEVAEETFDQVRKYALFWARVAMGQTGKKGAINSDDVRISFVIEEPTPKVGEPGVTYNRIRIGGAATESSVSSNPNYPWGNGPDDTGNATVDDISRSGANQDWGVFTHVLSDPDHARVTWSSTLLPLIQQPLTSSDAEIFKSNFEPVSNDDRARYKDVSRALEMVGQEIGAMIAHFVARATGLPPGVSGVSRVPDEVGEYANLSTLGFTTIEREVLNNKVNFSDLPGTSGTLSADWLPLAGVSPFLLPNATTLTFYDYEFEIAGGRPNLDGDDLVFSAYLGSLPINYVLVTNGSVEGFAPLRVNSQVYCGVFIFAVRVRDTEAEESSAFSHRLNLLADADNPQLTENERALARDKNEDILGN